MLTMRDSLRIDESERLQNSLALREHKPSHHLGVYIVRSTAR